MAVATAYYRTSSNVYIWQSQRLLWTLISIIELKKFLAAGPGAGAAERRRSHAARGGTCSAVRGATATATAADQDTGNTEWILE